MMIQRGCMGVGLLIATCLFASPLQAQNKHKGSPNALAADVVFLNDKTTFYGVINDVTDDEVTLVVEREWLKASHPQLYRNHTQKEAEVARKAEAKLIERIGRWIEERPDETNLVLFLEDEQKAVQKRIDDVDFSAKRFTWLRFPKSDIRRVVLQKAKQRQIVLVAWHQNLTDAVVRTAEDLSKELEKQNVNIDETNVDFADDVPGTPQTDREWALRKAVVEFVMMKPLEFQGTGDAFFRRGEQPGMLALVKQMMGQGGMGGIQQIGEELGLPEFTRGKDRQRDQTKKDWWKDQAKIADEEGLRCFSITKLDQNLMLSKVQVQVYFFARDEEEQWTMVSKFEGVSDADRQSDADVEALMEDPQVKKILEVAETMGLGASANIKKALRHGVATQAAMQQGLDQLVKFTDKYSRRLDSPKIPSTGK